MSIPWPGSSDPPASSFPSLGLRLSLGTGTGSVGQAGMGFRICRWDVQPGAPLLQDPPAPPARGWLGLSPRVPPRALLQLCKLFLHREGSSGVGSTVAAGARMCRVGLENLPETGEESSGERERNKEKK